MFGLKKRRNYLYYNTGRLLFTKTNRLSQKATLHSSIRLKDLEQSDPDQGKYGLPVTRRKKCRTIAKGYRIAVLLNKEFWRWAVIAAQQHSGYI